jgi:hypothetical protein|tara:strand:+ start:198 stop:476 length:279 start_codon:yes stop_codon:yes gene_type:complete
MKSLLKKKEEVEEVIEEIEAEEEAEVIETPKGSSVSDLISNATGKAEEVLKEAYKVKGEATNAMFLKRKVEAMQAESGNDYSSIIESIEGLE